MGVNASIRQFSMWTVGLRPDTMRRKSSQEREGVRSMCGIVGYVGFRDAADVILEGLRRLEYRGYDSAGIATVNGERQLSCGRKAS